MASGRFLRSNPVEYIRSFLLKFMEDGVVENWECYRTWESPSLKYPLFEIRVVRKGRHDLSIVPYQDCVALRTLPNHRTWGSQVIGTVMVDDGADLNMAECESSSHMA